MSLPETAVAEGRKAFESAPLIFALLAVTGGVLYFNHLQMDGLRKEISDLQIALREEMSEMRRTQEATANLVLLNLATDAEDSEKALTILKRFTELQQQERR